MWGRLIQILFKQWQKTKQVFSNNVIMSRNISNTIVDDNNLFWKSGDNG